MTSDSENDKREILHQMIRASYGRPFSSLDRRIGESDASFIIRQSYGGGPFSSLDRQIGESDANFIIRQSYGGGSGGRGSYN